MKRSGLAVMLVLTVFAACDDRDADQLEADGAVPPGAIPAAPDARPGAAEPESLATVIGDTSSTAAPVTEADTVTTGAGAEGGIRPR